MVVDQSSRVLHKKVHRAMSSCLVTDLRMYRKSSKHKWHKPRKRDKESKMNTDQAQINQVAHLTAMIHQMSIVRATVWAATLRRVLALATVRTLKRLLIKRPHHSESTMHASRSQLRVTWVNSCLPRTPVISKETHRKLRRSNTKRWSSGSKAGRNSLALSSDS